MFEYLIKFFIAVFLFIVVRAVWRSMGKTSKANETTRAVSSYCTVQSEANYDRPYLPLQQDGQDPIVAAGLKNPVITKWSTGLIAID
jgi:hypothetical protein